MARFDSYPSDRLIAAAILNAPGWARVGLTMPDPVMRERAADELARAIVAGIDPPGHEDQLALSL